MHDGGDDAAFYAVCVACASDADDDVPCDEDEEATADVVVCEA
jgi:hypothetical protein